MHALKLIQHMKNNADRMADSVIDKVRMSDRCSELVAKVPVEEQRRNGQEVYRDLTDWLATQADSTIADRYVSLGTRRAQQGVPFTNLYWAVSIAHEHLWEYMQQECLLEEPVEFWGGVGSLRSLTQFFNRVLYFAAIGYESAHKRELTGVSAA